MKGHWVVELKLQILTFVYLLVELVLTLDL